MAGFPTSPAPNDRQHPSGFRIAGNYNGKIDSPRLCNRALFRLEIEMMKAGANQGLNERTHCGPTGALAKCLIVSWDFGQGIETLVAHDRGPFLLHAALVNCPPGP
jgi:N,N-dimethylformamidase